MDCFMGGKGKYEGCTTEAVALAPQTTRASSQGFTFEGERFIYVPVCAGHFDGWFEGADVLAWPAVIPLLSAPELDTILAALRYWQMHGGPSLTRARTEHQGGRIGDQLRLIIAIAQEHGPSLGMVEIDQLCQRINN